MSAEIPELPGFTDCYGMKVSSIGEDGNLIILGHHNPTYALAAFTAYSVDVIGLADVYDGSVADPGPTAAKAISHEWASLLTECDDAGDKGHDPDGCSECDERKGFSWYIQVGQVDGPQTFPVTYFTA